MHVTYHEFVPRRRFGVELEVSPNLNRPHIARVLRLSEELSGTFHEVIHTKGQGPLGYALTNQNNYWHVKYDSTCGPLGKDNDHGWEVASYIGSTVADVHNIAEAAGDLALCGAKTNDNCGLHIHYETKDFSMFSMGAFLACWLKVEPFLMEIAAPRRRDNPHCRPLWERVIDTKSGYNPRRPDRFWETMAPKDFSPHNNPDKRYTLNTIGFAKTLFDEKNPRNTIEVRLPECLLDPDHVRNWTILIMNFIDGFLKQWGIPGNIDIASSVSQVLDLLSLGHTSSFKIYDKRLWDTKVWFLKKLVMSKRPWVSRQAKEILAFVRDF